MCPSFKWGNIGRIKGKTWVLLFYSSFTGSIFKYFVRHLEQRRKAGNKCFNKIIKIHKINSIFCDLTDNFMKSVFHSDITFDRYRSEFIYFFKREREHTNEPNDLSQFENLPKTDLFNFQATRHNFFPDNKADFACLPSEQVITLAT